MTPHRSRLAMCLAVLLSVTGPVRAQECPGGRIAAGDLGIRSLQCRGPAASCAINVAGSPATDVRHVFAVEPIIAAVDDGSDLRVGDTLVAIDEILITTAAGGARLARPPIGRTATLLVRRDGALREVSVRVRVGCGITALAVTR